MKSLNTSVMNWSLVVGLGLVAAGCSPTQKDPPFAGVINRQEVDVSKVELAGDNPLSIIGIQTAWQKSTGRNPDGSRVVVAVIGTGIDYTNDDLRESLWVNTGEMGDRFDNGQDDDFNGLQDDLFGYDFFSGDGIPYDWYGHDSFTAALIAATGRKNPEVIGAAPNASLMVLRYLGPDGRGSGGETTAFDAANAIRYAVTNGAKIIYMNWPEGGFSTAQAVVINAIADAGASNVLVVIPAGNSSNQKVPSFLTAIAGMANVVVVAGVDTDGRIYERSNYGKALASVAAPVVNARGFFPGSRVSKELNTTSVAAAYTAGVAALLATQPGYGNAAKLKQALLEYAAPLRAGARPLDVLSEGVLSVSALK